MSLNLASIVFESARKYAESPALSMDISYQKLANHVQAFAFHLHKKGVCPGDHVALMCENRPEFTIAYFAILTVGAVVVPINILHAPREVSFCIQDANVKVVVHSQMVAEKLTQSMAFVGWDVTPVCIPEPTHAFAQENTTLPTWPFPTASDDTAVIFYTSGTTGRPKGAEVTHFNLFSNAQWVSERSLAGSGIEERYWGPGHRTLAALSLSHSFGQTCMQNAPLLNGGAISYLAKFDTEKALVQIAEDKVTILAAVPRMIHDFMAVSQSHQLPHLKYCLVGGAPINQQTAEAFEKRYQVAVLEGYGLSETSPVIVFRTPEMPRKEGSVGRPIKGVEIKAVDKVGCVCAPGDVGEIVVRGHAVMKGYYNNAKATRETIQNGWLHTGDMGYLDDEDDVFLLERKKDVIIRNGYNIYPAEVEQVICSFQGVIEVAVVGVTDEVCGQEIKAFIVGNVDTKELKQYCKQELAVYKYPRQIEIVDELPKGSKGQVLKSVLRDNG